MVACGLFLLSFDPFLFFSHLNQNPAFITDFSPTLSFSGFIPYSLLILGLLIEEKLKDVRRGSEEKRDEMKKGEKKRSLEIYR